LPTAVLPEPMGPMRNTLAVRGDMAREHSGNEAAARVYDGAAAIYTKLPEISRR
jgi:hypothetical protein